MHAGNTSLLSHAGHEDCSNSLKDIISHFIVWLATHVVKMKQIVHCGWIDGLW